ncbi:hypothetical protein [Martelella sp. HB161492]|uniref:hypothetical protein n=1 Tax=Martelella sp. HB161492 TaxID=2720726 RepID=UPI001591E089|nr:hypothetical protein [Martelella sp. HB161492]
MGNNVSTSNTNSFARADSGRRGEVCQQPHFSGAGTANSAQKTSSKKSESPASSVYQSASNNANKSYVEAGHCALVTGTAVITPSNSTGSDQAKAKKN